ncbi:hypothetical protein F5Y18DRAFT_317171 [Xylariaceae sp. FL1019]|nr:hypothetical protein F5Y18DRAFT_317171 [Xylariaceae sp. FL1019]
MPHRVVDFFRAPNDNMHAAIKTVQKRRRSPAARTERQHPTRTPSYASSTDGSVEDHSPAVAPAVKTPDSAKERPKERHRISFPGLHLGGHKASKEAVQNTDASLDWKIESPPAILHGTPEESTGALVSGQLLLDVKNESFEVENLEAKLELIVTQKKPFHTHCHECSTQTTEIQKWSLLSEPTALTKRMNTPPTNSEQFRLTGHLGTHEFPFSVLLEGRLPASTDNQLLSVSYAFTAEAKPRDGGIPIKFNRKIDVRRSLPVPEQPHHSLRIFPPTDITASVHYDSVIHPLGTNRFQLRLDGVGKRTSNNRSVEYWKLKRLSWKLEESVKTVAPACGKHMPKPAGADAETKKGITRNETRVLAHADMHAGWKADYVSENGHVDAEVEYATAGRDATRRAVSCDLRASDGTEVSHRLVVEMVVAQEYAALPYTRHVTPTGVARILRMNFAVTITERSGLGVSWDNEAPPIYQDVPPSPPSYACAVIKHGSVEELSLAGPSALSDGAESPAYGDESPAYCEFPTLGGASPEPEASTS